MIRLHSFRLENVGFYKDSTFTFDRKGVSLIHGLNLNSANHNPNAAGKSAFFSQLPELITSEPLIGVRRDRLRKGRATLKLIKDEGGAKVKYVIVREIESGEKITVYRNGKDEEIHKLADAKRYVQHKIFETTDEELQTLNYLDSRVPHPLIMGDTAVRRAFFTRFFRLDKVDRLKKLIAAQLDEIKSVKVLYREVLDQFKEKKAQLLSEDQIDTLERKVSFAKQARAELIQQRNQFTQLAMLVELRGNEMYKRLFKLCEGDFASFDALRGFTNNEVQAAKLRVRIAQKWTQVKQERESYARLVQKTVDAINELWGEQEPPDAATVRKNAARYDDYVEYVNELKVKASGMDQRLESLVAQRVENNRKIKRLSQEFKVLLESDNCPTCGQPINSRKHLEKEETRITQELDAIKATVERLGAKMEALLAVIEENTAELDKAKPKLERLRKYRDGADLLSRMPEKPEAFDGEKLDEEEEREAYEKLSKRLDFIISCESMLSQFRKAAVLTEEEIKLASGGFDDSGLDRITAFLTTAPLKLENHDKLLGEVEELRERLRSMKKLLLEEEAYSLLSTAFSKQGIQTLMIRSICSRLEQQINRYAKLVFPENYTFSFELETQFNILVNRGGKNPQVSDIRKLSGAEYSLFGVLLLLGLMTFVPVSKRWNVLVLDEITARMGPEMVQAFMKFLPLLNKVIPHIIIISPRTEEHYEGATIFTAVKKGTVSKLVEGSTSSILEKMKNAS